MTSKRPTLATRSNFINDVVGRRADRARGNTVDTRPGTSSTRRGPKPAGTQDSVKLRELRTTLRHTQNARRHRRLGSACHYTDMPDRTRRRPVPHTFSALVATRGDEQTQRAGSLEKPPAVPIVIGSGLLPSGTEWRRTLGPARERSLERRWYSKFHNCPRHC